MQRRRLWVIIIITITITTIIRLALLQPTRLR